MDFELSDDQVALVDGIRSLLQGRFDIEAVRGLEVNGGVDRTRWKELADTGVFSLVVPESDGGVGLGHGDAVLVFEELGRALVPGPLVGSFLAAGVIDGAASGDTIVGVVERSESGPVIVEYLGSLDALVVLDHAGAWRVDPRVLDASPLHQPLDPLTPAWRVAALPAGEQVGDATLARSWRARGATLTSALQLGVAEGACDLATAYAKQRFQFGKPIGQFQAIKHLCAEMVSRVEVCRAAVYMAGVCLDDPSVGDPARAASAARILADNTSSENGKDCVQIHGGMGYTWEVDAHLYVKRAWVLATVFGSSDDHAEALAALL
ncbi:MAG TPA: acyl-CoA dehydrogenase family protein [Acidimicrobiales bacterium]|jgi:alkylation response protein AidB-like acyl-CoA dehydrogenase|nr:acyl-CoA dehydrogenase family protein [Acidimicrobiales bacterium]